MIPFLRATHSCPTFELCIKWILYSLPDECMGASVDVAIMEIWENWIFYTKRTEMLREGEQEAELSVSSKKSWRTKDRLICVSNYHSRADQVDDTVTRTNVNLRGKDGRGSVNFFFFCWGHIFYLCSTQVDLGSTRRISGQRRTKGIVEGTIRRLAGEGENVWHSLRDDLWGICEPIN